MKRAGTRLGVIAFLAACGSPAASPGPERPEEPVTNTGTAPAISLERIERIARACLADREGTPLDWNKVDIERGKDGWRVRVDETKPPVGNPSYVDVIVDPAASTCDGRAIESRVEDGDGGIDRIIEIARKCHGPGQVDDARTEVAYHRLATGDVERGHYDVWFQAPGSTTIPAPHYRVDYAAQTCKRVDDMF